MPLKLFDIVQTEELKTRFFAGASGSQRVVRWAHVCELPDPTEWLGEDDLLMTTGLGIPAAARKQKTYIEKLANAGLAGLMIGENMQAPDDLTALRDTADRLNFPVLLTEYGIPFSSVTRAIIDAERKTEFDRRNAFSRLSVTARMAIEGLHLEQLMARLEKDLSASLMILEPQQASIFWHPKNVPIPEDLREALRNTPLDFSSGNPAIRRYMVTSGEILAIRIPSPRNLVLLTENRQKNFIDYSLLHHLAAVVSISIEHLYVGVERSLRIGSQLLDDLMHQRLSPYELSKQVGAFQLDLSTSCIGTTRPGENAHVQWGMRLYQMQVPVVFQVVGDDVIILSQREDFSTIQRIIGSEIGVSDSIGNYQRLPDALREARLALLHTSTQTCRFYSEIIDRLPWLPESLDQAKDSFIRLLGPLDEYDKVHGSHLLHSLKTFLEHNRSWVIASEKLHVHKTTLVYRIRKIESLTRRSLDSTEDVAILWLALKSGEIAGLIKKE